MMPLLPPMIFQTAEINVAHNKEAAKVSLLSTLYFPSHRSLSFVRRNANCVLRDFVSSFDQIILTLLRLFLSVAALWQDGDCFVLL